MLRITLAAFALLAPTAVFASAVLVPRGTEQPSFDCSKARTASARLICADGELAKLDGQLAVPFRQRLGQLVGADREAFITLQRQWINARNARCGLTGKDKKPIEVLASAKECMAGAINARIAQLNTLQQSEPNSEQTKAQARDQLKPVRQEDYQTCNGKGFPSPQQQINACNTIIQSRPEPRILLPALGIRGVMHSLVGRYHRAIADFSQAIHLDPTNFRVWNSRCFARAVIGQLDAALSDCNVSLRLQPNEANTLDSRALVHLKMGRLDRAIDDYSAALQINPKLAISLQGRGTAKHRTGDSAGGDGDIAAAKALTPSIDEQFARIMKGQPQFDAAEIARIQAAQREAVAVSGATQIEQFRNFKAAFTCDADAYGPGASIRTIIDPGSIDSRMFANDDGVLAMLNHFRNESRRFCESESRAGRLSKPLPITHTIYVGWDRGGGIQFGFLAHDQEGGRNWTVINNNIGNDLKREEAARRQAEQERAQANAARHQFDALVNESLNAVPRTREPANGLPTFELYGVRIGMEAQVAWAKVVQRFKQFGQVSDSTNPLFAQKCSPQTIAAMSGDGIRRGNILSSACFLTLTIAAGANQAIFEIVEDAKLRTNAIGMIALQLRAVDQDFMFQEGIKQYGQPTAQEGRGWNYWACMTWQKYTSFVQMCRTTGNVSGDIHVKLRDEEFIRVSKGAYDSTMGNASRPGLR